MADLKCRWEDCMRCPSDSCELRKAVLDAVLHGSKKRTPFWHTSTSLASSYRWLSMAGYVEHSATTGSQPSGPRPERVGIRIDIWAWYQSGQMPDEALVDLSTKPAQKRFFTREWDEYGHDVDSANQALSFSDKTREVLIKWRGAVPLQCCEVINMMSGQVVGKLEDMLAHVQKEGVAQLDSNAVRAAQASADQGAAASSGSQPIAKSMPKTRPPPALKAPPGFKAPPPCHAPGTTLLVLSRLPVEPLVSVHCTPSEPKAPPPAMALQQSPAVVPETRPAAPDEPDPEKPSENPPPMPPSTTPKSMVAPCATPSSAPAFPPWPLRFIRQKEETAPPHETPDWSPCKAPKRRICFIRGVCSRCRWVSATSRGGSDATWIDA